MLSDTDAAGLAIVLALCLVKERNRSRIKEKKTTIQTRKSHGRLHFEGYPRVSLKRLKIIFLVLFSGLLFNGILKTVTLQSLKRC